jgi:hypothetical protein
VSRYALRWISYNSTSKHLSTILASPLLDAKFSSLTKVNFCQRAQLSKKVMMSCLFQISLQWFTVFQNDPAVTVVLTVAARCAAGGRGENGLGRGENDIVRDEAKSVLSDASLAARCHTRLGMCGDAECGKCPSGSQTLCVGGLSSPILCVQNGIPQVCTFPASHS